MCMYSRNMEIYIVGGEANWPARKISQTYIGQLAILLFIFFYIDCFRRAQDSLVIGFEIPILFNHPLISIIYYQHEINLKKETRHPNKSIKKEEQGNQVINS